MCNQSKKKTTKITNQKKKSIINLSRNHKKLLKMLNHQNKTDEITEENKHGQQ